MENIKVYLKPINNSNDKNNAEVFKISGNNVINIKNKDYFPFGIIFYYLYI